MNSDKLHARLNHKIYFYRIKFKSRIRELLEFGSYAIKMGIWEEVFGRALELGVGEELKF